MILKLHLALSCLHNLFTPMPNGILLFETLLRLLTLLSLLGPRNIIQNSNILGSAAKHTLISQLQPVVTL